MTMGVVKLLSPFGRLVDQTIRLAWEGPLTFARVTELPYVVSRAIFCDGEQEPYVVWETAVPFVLKRGDAVTLDFNLKHTTVSE